MRGQVVVLVSLNSLGNLPHFHAAHSLGVRLPVELQLILVKIVVLALLVQQVGLVVVLVEFEEEGES
mgnify:CR=1 FL=1